MAYDKFVIGISYVGGPEYLDRAIGSIPLEYRHRILIVNSTEPYQETSPPHICELRPTAPLSHTQTHNVFQEYANEADCLFVMHNDAEVEPLTIDALLIMRRDLPANWGVVFTNYDAFAMYNPSMWKAIGPWDWKLFPSYYSDNDYYRRAKLGGWKLIDSGLPVKHEGSHVINKIDKWAKFYNHTLLHNHARENYIAKWGGPPDEEKYIIPFDLPRGPYPDE